jgi:hypothetical protein
VSPQKRISPILKRALTAEENAVAQQLKLLGQMRRAVLSALADATDYGVWHLTAILRAIDAEVDRLSSEAGADIGATMQDVYRIGIAMVDAATGEGDTAGSFAGISTNLVQAAVELGQEHVLGVWTELGSKLKSTIRRVTFGITDPGQAIGQVARLIRDPKTFGSTEARAETIVRTEVNRTFSISSFTRMQQSARAMGGRLRKGWLSAEDTRVRDAHQEAADKYSAESGGIPVNEPFVVDGEELMYPLDPAGSAGNTINCRCRTIPVIGAVGEAYLGYVRDVIREHYQHHSTWCPQHWTHRKAS